MLVHKRIPLRMILRVEGKSISLFFALAIGIYAIHQFTNLPIELPVAMAATLGTAVSVLLGFKNNAAYERWWQARQNWGAIVNHSRILGIQLLTYTDWNQNLPDRERQKLPNKLFQRHFAYINTLRLQLRDLPNGSATDQWLDALERDGLARAQNRATQILKNQAARLRELASEKLLGQFQLFELMHTLEALLQHQGKSEGIKNTPLMRHYSSFTTAFVWGFVLLIPLCFVELLGWRMVPFVVLISQIFVMLDRAGSLTESPFTNDFNSVPLDAMTRTIEIDMLQQLGINETPSPIKAVDGVLM